MLADFKEYYHPSRRIWWSYLANCEYLRLCSTAILKDGSWSYFKEYDHPSGMVIFRRILPPFRHGHISKNLTKLFGQRQKTSDPNISIPSWHDLEIEGFLAPNIWAEFILVAGTKILTLLNPPRCHFLDLEKMHSISRWFWLSFGICDSHEFRQNPKGSTLCLLNQGDP